MGPRAGRDRAAGRARQPRLIVPTPAGRPFTQAVAAELAAEPWLLFACGRYEGIDARVVDYAAQRMPVDEISLGDYVLAGGEAAVLVIAEAVGRLLPGVLGNAESAVDDSFAAGAGGLLEGPAYTKPAVVARPGRPAGAAVGQSRRDRPLAARTQSRGSAPGHGVRTCS